MRFLLLHAKIYPLPYYDAISRGRGEGEGGRGALPRALIECAVGAAPRGCPQVGTIRRSAWWFADSVWATGGSPIGRACACDKARQCKLKAGSWMSTLSMIA